MAEFPATPTSATWVSTAKKFLPLTILATSFCRQPHSPYLQVYKLAIQPVRNVQHYVLQKTRNLLRWVSYILVCPGAPYLWLLSCTRAQQRRKQYKSRNLLEQICDMFIGALGNKGEAEEIEKRAGEIMRSVLQRLTCS